MFKVTWTWDNGTQGTNRVATRHDAEMMKTQLYMNDLIVGVEIGEEVKVMKAGTGWAVINADTDEEMYRGKTRVSCFRWVHANGAEIVEYQHGGNQ